MPDRFDRPSFWSLLHNDLEAWLKADAGVAALLTKTPTSGTPFVDVAQGITPSVPAPCIRIMRGNEGGQALTGFQSDAIPEQIEIDLAMCSQQAAPRDKDLSARAPWDALALLEAATLAALRRYFAPTRSLSSILGAPFEASILSITPTDGGYYPVVGSTISIVLNKAE